MRSTRDIIGQRWRKRKVDGDVPQLPDPNGEGQELISTL